MINKPTNMALIKNSKSYGIGSNNSKGMTKKVEEMVTILEFIVTDAGKVGHNEMTDVFRIKQKAQIFCNIY